MQEKSRNAEDVQRMKPMCSFCCFERGSGVAHAGLPAHYEAESGSTLWMQVLPGACEERDGVEAGMKIITMERALSGSLTLDRTRGCT